MDIKGNMINRESKDESSTIDWIHLLLHARMSGIEIIQTLWLPVFFIDAMLLSNDIIFQKTKMISPD